MVRCDDSGTHHHIHQVSAQCSCRPIIEQTEVMDQQKVLVEKGWNLQVQGA